MAEVAPAPAATTVAKAAKKKATGQRKTGPSVTELIVKTVAASKERGGVSAAALKKALAAAGYDVEKNKARVRIAIRSLVANGTLVQLKGTGASGSYKMSKKPAEPKAKTTKKAAPKSKKTAATRKPAPKKPTAAKKPKTAAAKKAATAKKSPKKEKKTAAAKKAPKSPKNVTKTVKKVTKKAPATKRSPVKKAARPKVKKAAPKKK